MVSCAVTYNDVPDCPRAVSAVRFTAEAKLLLRGPLGSADDHQFMDLVPAQMPVERTPLVRLVVGSLLAAATGAADPATPQYEILGPSASCGEFVGHRQRNEGMQYLDAAWALGFLSGQAVASKRDLLRGQSAESLLLWIENYCKKHPLDTVATAGDQLLTELKQWPERPRK